MIVPFSDIPSAILTPLNVDTKARYTLDMNKFPGLSSEGPHEPALLPAPQQVITNTTGHDREPCSCQLSFSSRSTTATTAPVTSTRFNSCFFRSHQSTPSLIETQRELHQLLDAYQVEYPEVSTIVSNPAVPDRGIISSKSCMESIPRSVYENKEMCEISPHNMLSTCSKIASSSLYSCHGTGQLASCDPLRQGQPSVSNGGTYSCRYQNGSISDGACRNVTLQSCSCSFQNSISGCGVFQGFASTQPLLVPVSSSCRLAAFPVPDCTRENNSQFSTNHRFDKTSCSFRERVMPYTFRRNVGRYSKQTSNMDFHRVPNTPLYISPVMKKSMLSFASFQLESIITNSNQCLLV